MPISFAPGGSHYDVTPLENLFIENFMTEATGEFVKVYIYGLMFCYRREEQTPGCADIARDLHMNEDTVRAAFAYWEKLQLVSVLSQNPLTVEYVNLKQKFSGGATAQEREKDRVLRDLADDVQAVFSGERVIGTGEFNRVFDWYEVLKFEPAAIALMIRYCVGKKGMKVSFNYMDTVAQELAAKEITSAEAMEAYLMGQEALNSGAARVLARWSLRRAPTVDEMLLYRKWTEEWGFTEDAIIAACRETTAATNPSFKYLDSILDSLYTDGYVTTQDILSGLEERRRKKDICAEIAKALGLRASASNSAELARLYEHFSAQGFTDAAIQMAARMLALEGRNTLADLVARLNKWQQDGTVSDDSLMTRSARDEEGARAVKRWVELWGQSRAPAPGEVSAYLRFTGEWGLSADLVEYAAECAALAEKPLAMMGRMLSDWREKGIADRRRAQEDRARSRQAGGGAEDFSDRRFQNQNTYTDEQFEKMDADVFSFGKSKR